MPWLINAAQLDKFRKSQKNVVVLDASWHLPDANCNAKEEFLMQHIQGARFLDINEFSNTKTSIPNMLISDEKIISEKLGLLGISNDCKIIFYDNSVLHSSCRALWMFKVFGHDPNQLYILDGGFKAWEEYGGKMEQGECRVSKKDYEVRLRSELIKTLAQMKKNLQHPKEQVIDMRHAVRFCGGKEHREGLRCGHIPGTFSFPYMTMFDLQGRFKSLEKIRKQLQAIGVEMNHPIATMCGSGMTAAILNFVLDLLNHPSHALYDGSWCEWGSSELFSGETSLSERPVDTCIA